MTSPRIADLTVAEFKQLVRESVAQSVAAALSDPDEGLRLRDDFAEELQRSLAEVDAGEETTSLADAAERLQSSR
jgi:hypothetical protein